MVTYGNEDVGEQWLHLGVGLSLKHGHTKSKVSTVVDRGFSDKYPSRNSTTGWILAMTCSISEKLTEPQKVELKLSNKK